MVCQTGLTWVSSDTPGQTIRPVVRVSGGPGSILTGTQASSGKSGPAATDDRASCESALRVTRDLGLPGAEPSSSRKHQTLTPGAGSRSSSEPRAPADGARSGTSASGRRAPARKVKMAGAWVSVTELRKPVTPLPTCNPNGYLVSWCFEATSNPNG